MDLEEGLLLTARPPKRYISQRRAVIWVIEGEKEENEISSAFCIFSLHILYFLLLAFLS